MDDDTRRFLLLDDGWRGIASVALSAGVVGDVTAVGPQVVVGASSVPARQVELDIGAEAQMLALDGVGNSYLVGARTGVALVPAESYALRISLVMGAAQMTDATGDTGPPAFFLVGVRVRPVEVRFGEARSVYFGAEVAGGGLVGPVTIGTASGGLLFGVRPPLAI